MGLGLSGNGIGQPVPSPNELTKLGSDQTVSPDREITASQRTIASKQKWDLVYFPLGDQVVINEHGAFVPNSFFGEAATLLSKIEAGPHGAQIVIFPQPGPNSQSRTPAHSITNEWERRWLSEHGPAYAGQWVALSEHRLLAFGADPTAVYRAARCSGVDSPFVAFIEAEEQLPFAGW